MQFSADSDINILPFATESTHKIFNSKSTALCASNIAEIQTNTYINSRETTSWLIAGLLMLYIAALMLSKKNLSVFGIMLFSKNQKNIGYNNFSRGFAQTANILVAFSMFIFTLFFYMLESHANELHKTAMELFTVIATAVCIYVIFKMLTIKIIGYISENDELKSKLFAVEIIIFSIYGLFLGFFLALCFANPINGICVWVTAIFAIIILLNLLKMSRIAMIFIDEKISPFFLILYLCAIEILPAWLIIDLL
jgi:hypothetical protein